MEFVIHENSVLLRIINVKKKKKSSRCLLSGVLLDATELDKNVQIFKS